MPYSIGRGKHTCTKVISVGEVAMHENADGSYRTVIGDGKTPLNELPTFSGEPRVTLRDTFAAAALTGMLGSGDLVIDPRNGTAATLTVRDAYQWADAMLRERARQPAPPCVETDGFSSGSDNGAMRAVSERESPRRECGESSLRDVPQDDKSRAAGGPEHHTHEPVAWAVLAKDIGATAATCSTFMEAKRLAARSADPYKAIVPLYRQPQPTLIDAEREAIKGAIDVLEQEDQWHAVGESRIKALRGLLERLR